MSMSSGYRPLTSSMTGPLYNDPQPEQNRQSSQFQPRHGILGWWLNLTAPARPNHSLSVPERERIRKSELTSYSILAIFACLLALVSNSLDDPSTAEGVGLMAVFLIVAAILNRTGHTRFAAYLTPGAMMLLIAAVIIEDTSLRLTDLPLYDLFVIPTILVAFIGDRRAPWFFALIAMGFVVATFMFKPYEIIIVNGTAFNGIAYETRIFGIWGMINRSLIVIFFAALFGWMGARSVDFAIARADQAEELARLEHAFVEQTRQLEEGIRQIQETHVSIAQGNYNARAPLSQDNVLWQIAYSLNNLVQRLQKSADAEFMLRRVTEDIKRLVQEIQRAKSGYAPMWPVPSGTPVDHLIREFEQSGPPRRIR